MSKLHGLTSEELHDLATAHEIEGRSSMNKDALVDALVDAGVGLEALSRDQLLRLAEADEIKGRSSMNKDALVSALEGDTQPVDEPGDHVGPEPGFTALVDAVSDEHELPVQDPTAEDRLGGAPPEADAPVGVHYDPEARVDQAGYDDSGETYPGYVPPFRPIPVTSIAGYPATNTAES